MWIFPWINLSWYSWYMSDKLGWPKPFWKFLCEGLSTHNLKGFCYSYMLGLAVHLKDRLHFAWDLSLENSADSNLCFQLALLHSVSNFFSSIDHLLHLYAQFLILFHLSLIRFFWSIHLLMCLSLETFNIHHMYWLTYSGRTDRPGELCYNFNYYNLKWTYSGG